MLFVSGPDKREWFFQTPNTFLAVLVGIHILSETGAVSISRGKGVSLVYHKFN